MADLTAKQLVELLRRSKLVEEKRIDEVSRECAAAYSGDEPLPAETLAQRFVDLGLITEWHSENLLNKKYKGFFLGKYKMLGLLGAGGMSSVYRARHSLMGNERAIKVLPRKRVGQASFLDRFLLEAEAIAKLDHPNIVRVYDIDKEGKTHYMVMELVRGPDLHSQVKERGPLSFDDVANYVAQAAEGLGHAHARNLIHRDVKPGNLLVDDEGMVKILDLGLALISDDERASLTIAHNENVLGTADYLAPEQALNSHNVDARVDIYGLGCSMYFLLTGHAPFPDGTIAQRILKHQNELPPDIRETRPDCPESLCEICFKMLQKKPEDRFQTMGEIARVLKAWRQEYVVLSEEAGAANGASPRISKPVQPSDTAKSQPRKVEKGGPSESSAETKIPHRPAPAQPAPANKSTAKPKNDSLAGSRRPTDRRSDEPERSNRKPRSPKKAAPSESAPPLAPVLAPEVKARKRPQQVGSAVEPTPVQEDTLTDPQQAKETRTELRDEAGSGEGELLMPYTDSEPSISEVDLDFRAVAQVREPSSVSRRRPARRRLRVRDIPWWMWAGLFASLVLLGVAIGVIAWRMNPTPKSKPEDEPKSQFRPSTASFEAPREPNTRHGDSSQAETALGAGVHAL